MPFKGPYIASFYDTVMLQNEARHPGDASPDNLLDNLELVLVARRIHQNVSFGHGPPRVSEFAEKPRAAPARDREEDAPAAGEDEGGVAWRDGAVERVRRREGGKGVLMHRVGGDAADAAGCCHVRERGERQMFKRPEPFVQMHELALRAREIDSGTSRCCNAISQVEGRAGGFETRGREAKDTREGGRERGEDFELGLLAAPSACRRRS